MPRETPVGIPVTTIQLIEDWGLGFKMGSALVCLLNAIGRKPAAFPGEARPKAEIDLGELDRCSWFLRRASNIPTEKFSKSVGYRKISPEQVIEQYGLFDPIGRLGLVLRAIADNEPSEALDDLNVYLMRSTGGEADADADANTRPWEGGAQDNRQVR